MIHPTVTVHIPQHNTTNYKPNLDVGNIFEQKRRPNLIKTQRMNTYLCYIILDNQMTAKKVMIMLHAEE